MHQFYNVSDRSRLEALRNTHSQEPWRGVVSSVGRDCLRMLYSVLTKNQLRVARVSHDFLRHMLVGVERPMCIVAHASVLVSFRNTLRTIRHLFSPVSTVLVSLREAALEPIFNVVVTCKCFHYAVFPVVLFCAVLPTAYGAPCCYSSTQLLNRIQAFICLLCH